MDDQQPLIESAIKSRLDGITTDWTVVNDSSKFTLRYASAIRRYIESMVDQSSDMEDILQDFLVQVVTKGFARASADRGKFRYYVKASVRNAVRMFYRKKERRGHTSDPELFSRLSADDSTVGEENWNSQWRQCLLDRTWEALRRHQQQSPGNLAFTVLRLTTDEPTASSADLALRAAQQSGRPVRPDAFRKQLSRARRKFAELMVLEVVQTLENASAQDVEQELIDLGFLSYVREYLPNPR